MLRARLCCSLHISKHLTVARSHSTFRRHTRGPQQQSHPAGASGGTWLAGNIIGRSANQSDQADAPKRASEECSRIFHVAAVLREKATRDHHTTITQHTRHLKTCKKNGYVGHLTHICSECGDRFPTAAAWECHIREQHGGLHLCQHCQVHVHGTEEFAVHLMQHTQHADCAFTCPVCHIACGNVLNTERHVAQHFRAAQQGGTKRSRSSAQEDMVAPSPVPAASGAGAAAPTQTVPSQMHCPGGCGRTGMTMAEYLQHVAECVPLTALMLPHPCWQCGDRFRISGGVIDHTKACHGGVYRCAQCNEYRTSNLDNMRAHEAKHRGDRLYQCNECKEWFPGKTGLDRHIKTHMSDKERTRACSDAPACDRTFGSYSGLKDHEATCAAVAAATAAAE